MNATARGLGGRVRALRRQRGWTQHQLAEAPGVSRATIARIEAGDSNPDLDTLGMIARALGVRTYALLYE